MNFNEIPLKIISISITRDLLRGMVLGVLCATAWRWSLLAYGLPGLVLLWQLHRLLDRLWWQPRRLERELRAQGIHGTSYRFLAGDLREQGRRNKEAWSRPLPLRCHDIAPRVAPFPSDSVREHGKVSLSWFGPIPKVTIADPDLAKHVLSNKFEHLETDTVEAARQWPLQPRGRQVGQSQAGPKPCFQSRKDQGI
jgi:hypothetical protein